MEVMFYSETEVRWKQMSSSGWLKRGRQVLYCQSGFGLGCTPLETIGRHGRFSGAALCAEWREQVGCVGG
jgi:hypothetical protein